MPPRVGRDLDGSRAGVRYHEYARMVGLASLLSGRKRAVARHFGCSLDFVRYHARKAVDPTFRPGRWGGSKGRARFVPHAAVLVEAMLWQEVRADPIRTVAEFALVLRSNGFDVTQRWVQLRFRQWGFSRQRPSYLNINKFTASNIFYYGYVKQNIDVMLGTLTGWLVWLWRSTFVLEVRQIPWIRLKFLDESSFDTRSKSCSPRHPRTLSHLRQACEL
jgi:hypothetical protein